MKVEFGVGPLRLEPSSGPNPNTTFAITHPCVGNPSSVYVVAFIELDKRGDGCDLRTCGQRPWEIQGTDPDHFFQFAYMAMKFLNGLVRDDWLDLNKEGT